MSDSAVQQPPEAWITLAPPATGGRPPGHPYRFAGYRAGRMGRLYMAHERIGPAFRALFNEVMFQPGELDRREREMIAAVTAAAQDCFY